MSKFIVCYLHLCRTAIITASPAALTGYETWRLGDGHIGRKFKFSTAATPSLVVDQGTSPSAVTRMFVPGGTHNLSGMRLTLSYSDNGSAYTQADQYTVPDGGDINRPFAAQTHRYWRLFFDNGSGGNPGAPPELAELFLTADYIFERNPSYPVSEYGDDTQFNVDVVETVSGSVGFYELGPEREQYSLNLVMTNAMAANVRAWMYAWAGKNPFPIIDDSGNLLFVYIAKKGAMVQKSFSQVTQDLVLKEVLP